MSVSFDAALPKGWAWARVGDAGRVQLGRQRSPKDHSGPHMRPYLRVANVYDARIDTTDVLEMNFTPDEFETFKLAPGDILLNEGQSLEWVGRAAIYRGEVPGACFQNTLVRFRAHHFVLPEFALLVFRHYLFAQVFQRIARWTTNIAHLGSERFASLPFPVPPLKEQRRIVAASDELLSDVDAGIGSLKRAQANLKRYRASVLKAACEGRLVPTEAEIAESEGRVPETGLQLLERIEARRREWWQSEHPQKKYSPSFDIDDNLSVPPGWIWCRFDALTTLITSGSRGWGDRYTSVGPLFIRAQDIKHDVLDLANVAHVGLPESAEGTRTRVFRNDLLVTITGANVTKSARVTTGLPEAYVSQHVALVRPVIPETSAYMLAWFLSPAHGRGVLTSLAYGAGKPGLNLNHIRDLRIALPPLAEQQRIVDEVARRFSIVDEVESEIASNLRRAAALRQSILRHAFEGKLVPQDPNHEPASELLARVRAERDASAPAKKSAKLRRKAAPPAEG